MNPKERYLATLEGRPGDHLAWLPILMQFASDHIGSNYGEFASDHHVLCEACYAKAGNPFMVNAGCEIPSGIPVDNLRALCTPLAWRP